MAPPVEAFAVRMAVACISLRISLPRRWVELRSKPCGVRRGADLGELQLGIVVYEMNSTGYVKFLLAIPSECNNEKRPV